MGNTNMIASTNEVTIVVVKSCFIPLARRIPYFLMCPIATRGGWIFTFTHTPALALRFSPLLLPGELADRHLLGADGVNRPPTR